MDICDCCNYSLSVVCEIGGEELRRKKELLTPYSKILYGVGYIGDGKYSYKSNKKMYSTWNGIFIRCYDENFQKKRPTYIGCTICEEWHNYQNFAKWYEENFYQIEGKTMHLDKDLLIKGNRTYSPDTCVFLPTEINNLFNYKSQTNKRKNNGEMVGAYKIHNKYKSFCGITIIENGIEVHKRRYLGIYNTQLEASTVYKKFKEGYLKEVANKYKELIPEKIYNAIYKWEVNIND